MPLGMASDGSTETKCPRSDLNLQSLILAGKHVTHCVITRTVYNLQKHRTIVVPHQLASLLQTRTLCKKLFTNDTLRGV